MKHLTKTMLACSVLAICSCASLDKSLLLSSAIGVGVGAGVGLVAGNNLRSTALGAGIGGATGLALGFVLHPKTENKTPEPPPKIPPELIDKIPSLSIPEVRKIWIPDKIEDNKYVSGHNVYILQKNSTWMK